MSNKKALDEMEKMGSAVQQQYEDILNHKRSQKLMSVWAEAERFYAGDQWPAATAATKNLPRPVINITNQICNHKVASVMNENVRMVFSAQDSEEESFEAEGADLFTKFSDTKWEDMRQGDVNESVLLTASQTGTGFWHYYWDNNLKGGNVLSYQGDMCVEEIDPINIFPCNMQEPNVQKQKYIIISSRAEVSNVKQQAKENGVPLERIELITSDNKMQDEAYEMAKSEVKGHEQVTVLTKYWKENGQVKFMKVASGVVFLPPRQVGPGVGLSLYPIESIQWVKRKKSFFGRGDIESIMPNQKAINFIVAMHILSIQNNAFPKIIALPNRLISQITNMPGEIIQAQEGTEDPFRYVQAPAVPGDVSNFVNELIGQTKDVSGANENALGEQTGGQLNATAIMQLQKAAGVPLETVKRRFYTALEGIGRIWEDFYKVYYDIPRNIVVKNDETNEPEVTKFNGADHAETNMNLKIDIGPASGYSEQMMMTSLDKFLDTQQITFEDYLEFVPQNVVPFKDRLLKKIQERNEQMALMQQQQEIAMMEQQAAEQQAMQQQQEMEMQAASQQQAVEEQRRKEDLALQNKKLNIETMKALNIQKGGSKK